MQSNDIANGIEGQGGKIRRALGPAAAPLIFLLLGLLWLSASRLGLVAWQWDRTSRFGRARTGVRNASAALWRLPSRMFFW